MFIIETFLFALIAIVLFCINAYLKHRNKKLKKELDELSYKYAKKISEYEQEIIEYKMKLSATQYDKT